jgi:hypothetical protein
MTEWLPWTKQSSPEKPASDSPSMAHNNISGEAHALKLPANSLQQNKSQWLLELDNPLDEHSQECDPNLIEIESTTNDSDTVSSYRWQCKCGSLEYIYHTYDAALSGFLEHKYPEWMALADRKQTQEDFRRGDAQIMWCIFLCLGFWILLISLVSGIPLD